MSGQPEHYLLFLLRLAETILSQDKSVSIFALDYSLAPESTYPAQLAEAAAAYAYLVDEKDIPASKILLAGDSAGGHLALSLLVHLHTPNSLVSAHATGQNEGRQKPEGGLLLLSPWLSLHHASESYITNAHTDILSAPFLQQCAERFLRGHIKSFNDPKTFNKNTPYLEFLNPSPRIDWEAILPSRVWIAAGDDEIFRDDIIQWVGAVRKAGGNSIKIDLELGSGKEHDWQWIETILNETARKDFLNGKVGDASPEFEDAAKIGRMIFQKIRTE